MNKYTAVFGKKRGRIMSVSAESVEEADSEFEREFSKPGRLAILERWDEDGRWMIVDDSDEVVTAEGVVNG